MVGVQVVSLREDKLEQARNFGRRMRRAVLVTLGITVAGFADGIWRAHYEQPTILGEKLHSVSSNAIHVHEMLRNRPLGYMRLQKPFGDVCEESWNCQKGLVCRQNADGVGSCSFCENNDECIERNEKQRCFNVTKEISLCKHKELWNPFDQSDFWITIITFFTIFLSAPAGVGGGCILVPMYLAIGGFSPHSSSALSTATIFGGALTNNYFNIKKRHPKKNRPLIDYSACIMLVPVLLIGTIIGVFFNAVSPGWLISVLLVCALIYTTWRTCLKAYETYQRESIPIEASETSRLLPDGSSAAKTPDVGDAKCAKQPATNAPPGDIETGGQAPAICSGSAPPLTDEERARELDAIAQAEASVSPWSVAALLACWLLVAVSAVLKGGDGAPGVAPCGSPGYWALVLLPVPFVGLLVWHLGAGVNADYERRVACGYDFADGDLRWTRRNVVAYPLYCASAGVCAGALGIAAGMVLGPLLLELGMTALVSTASSGFMVLFISSSTAFQFLIMGQLQATKPIASPPRMFQLPRRCPTAAAALNSGVRQADYALAFCGVGLVAGAAGNGVVGYLVRRYRKTWFVVGILAAVFALSSVLMAASGLRRALEEHAHGRSPYGQPLCPATPLLLHAAAAPP